MATPTLPPDQTATQWRDDAWLAAYPLSGATALDYFSGSPFYDRACVNERARASGLALDQVALMPPAPEYVLAGAEEPHLFIIHRRWRGAPGTIPTPQAVYYILEGAVYQAPAIGAVLAARLDRCLWTIKAAFTRMQADLDPLAALEAEAKAAADTDVGAATSTATPGQPPPPRPPPPRRYTDEERARMATAERVIGYVLRSLDGPKAQQGEGGEGGGEEEEGGDGALPMAV